MTSPVVSVLIPVYKGEAFITRAIESILSQTYPAVELLIVNDGSPDNSARLIAPYLADHRVRYFEQENMGTACARNTALARACGAFIGLCDQDDEWQPHKAYVQVAYLEKHPEVALVHSDVDYIDEDGQPLQHAQNYPAPVSGYCFPQMYMSNPIQPVSAMFRREVLDEVGRFDPSIKYADDYDLWLRIASRYPIGYVDCPLARYRWHAENTSYRQVAIRSYTLKVLRKAERELPHACAELRRSDRRLRHARLYHQMAGYALTQSLPLKAVVYALRSAALNPIYMAKRLMPARVLNLAYWYWSILTRFRR